MSELSIRELIDVGILQKIQKSFSDYTGMAALVTDEKGEIVTDDSNMSYFCMQINRESEAGCQRCAECGRKSSMATLEKGEPVIYNCHLGLVEFAVPIIVDERIIGNFVGGQVLVKPIDFGYVRQFARDFGLDEERFVEAAGNIAVRDMDYVNKAADFLCQLGEILSGMAYKSSEELKKSHKLERAAQSQSAFIMDMNEEFKKNMNAWLDIARQASYSGDPENMKNAIDDLLIKGTALLTSFSDTVEYAKMTGGKIELNETEYNIDYLLQLVCHNVETSAADKAVVFIRQVDENVPSKLLGDQGRIGQVITKLLMNSVTYMDEGMIDIHVSSKSCGYAEYVTIDITDAGIGMSEEACAEINDYFKNGNTKVFDKKESKEIGLSMISYLVGQMSGSVEVTSELGKGTTFSVCLPQLKLV